MASTVLSGSGTNITYTNNTGQNVRVVINYMSSRGGTINMSWAGSVSIMGQVSAIGRNLAFTTGSQTPITANNASPITGNVSLKAELPTEIMLAPGQTFSAACGAYNIVIIPEAG
jgi:hypothetical protein